MILGKSYRDIAKQFSTKALRAGLGTDKIRDFLGAHGFSLVTIRSSHYTDIETANARMKKLLFAPIHFVTVQNFANDTKQHAVVMDRKGVVYDPGPPPGEHWKRKLSDYYEVIEIIGCFPE